MNDIHRVYFIGAGGIGMSALARYFNSRKVQVAGYDRTPTGLTGELIKEGIDIHFEDDPRNIPVEFKNTKGTLVVYTPAVPLDHRELSFFRESGHEMVKRSVALGRIMEHHKVIAVAGTHGKTTISSMIAHIFRQSGKSCNAFLGGITRNYNTNLLLDPGSDYFIAEADEYDRSFLTLYPDIAIVSATDDDHLDIYKERSVLLAAFTQFTCQVKSGGTLIMKKGIEIEPYLEGRTIYTYSLKDKADFYGSGFRKEGLYQRFNVHFGKNVFKDLVLGTPGLLNIENAIAAFATAYQAGILPEDIKTALETYTGVRRRFEIIMNKPGILFIDDYAHHPEELKAFIQSVRNLVPGKKITGIFQPHLYTRTRDFAEAFSESLSLMDDVILLEIYPAREDPIKGVNSGMIFSKLSNSGQKILCRDEEVVEKVKQIKPEVLLTMGAGDIDLLVVPLREALMKMN